MVTRYIRKRGNKKERTREHVKEANSIIFPLKGILPTPPT
jgi:hypothetical protein